MALVPGSTVTWWLKVAAPQLVARGVLRKVGRRFMGRPSEIEQALMSSNGEPPVVE